MTRFPLPVALAALALALALAIVAGVAYGAVTIPPDRIIAVLAGGGDRTDATIVLMLRLPRVLGAALVGAALAVAGALLQGMLRNPLADPYVLGTSAGGALGAVVGLLLGGALGLFAVPTLAFAGALLSVYLVWRLARVGPETPVVTLLLAGVVLSAVVGSLITFLEVASDRLQLRLSTLLGLLVGGVSVISWTQLAIAAALVGVALVVGLVFAHRLDAFSFGDEIAAALGVDVEGTKRVVLTTAALLAAAAVSLAGLVGFVGLVAPHLVRAVLGPAHTRLVPAAALTGAAFLVAADLLARIALAPTELPVGVVTGLIGGPFFFALLWRQRAGYRL
ncbi:MAG TPA: iron ABC transporter permease [Candidatus Limnocylindria bacterium]|nr:iron ABC transporter permease [Candidatus Limnocylindria bacterium]